MNIEPGKCYRTRDGRKAVIYAVYPNQNKEGIHGGLYVDDEWCISFSWEKNGTCSYEPSGNDLVAPWSDDSQVSIPWDKLPGFIKFIAMDEDGKWSGYLEKPDMVNNYWWPRQNPYPISINLISEHRPKGYTGDWKDSLFERPHEEAKS
jgi:hypothetical protein